jgi:hypothetical protein
MIQSMHAPRELLPFCVVTDSVVTGKKAKLLTATTDKPIDIIEPLQTESVPVVQLWISKHRWPTAGLV